MIASISTLLLSAALAPAPPAAACPCEITDWRCRAEHPICKEVQTVPPAPAPTTAPVVQAPATDPEVTDSKSEAVLIGRTFRAHGGYVLAAGGVARHVDGVTFLWGLEGGGWIAMEKPLALGIGFRMENQPNFSWRFGIPFRLSVGNHYVSAYAVFTPSLIRGQYVCAPTDIDETDCKQKLGPDIQMGGGLMFLMGRGFLLGFEPSFNHSYWEFEDDYGYVTLKDSSFTFRTWLGWKFGKGTID